MSKEMEKKVEVTIGDKTEIITMAEAIVRQLARKAAGGDLKAAQLLAYYIDGKPIPSDRHAKDTGKPIKVVFGEEDAGL
jgi:hypothetical protein